MARFRYLKTAPAELRKIDPGCDVTERALKEWVAAGILPSLPVGCRTLIDIDAVLELIAHPLTPKSEESKIRRVG